MRILYPAKHEPVLTADQRPEQVTESRWHQPLSEPTRKRDRGYSAALIASGFVISAWALTQPETVSADRFLQPFSTPQKLARPGLPASAQQALAFVPVVTVAEDVTLDKWFAPLREPVRVRVSVDVNKQQAFAFVANDPIADTNTGKWFAPLSEPSVKQRQPVTSQQSLALGLNDPIASTDTGKWYAPLASPTRRLPFQAQAFFFAQPEDVTVGKWLVPLSEPVRRGGLGTAQQQAAAFYPGPIVVAETITVDKWFSAFAETQRQKIGLSASQQQSLAFVKAAPFEETVSADRWWQQFSQPSLAKRKTQPDGVSYAYFVEAAGETVTVDKWFREANIPVRSRDGLPTPQQQSVAFVKAQPFEETVSIDRWLQALTEPARRRGLGTHHQLSVAYVGDWVGSQRWFAPLSEPARIRPGLPTRHQQYLAWVQAAPFAEAVSIDRWLQPLSEPRWSKRPVPQQQFTALWPYPLPNLDAPAGVYPLYPDRATRKTLPTAEQQALAFVKAAPFAEATQLDKWFAPLSEPSVKTKRGPHVSVQDDFVGPLAETVTPDRWAQPISQPTRRVQTRATLSYAISDPFPRPTVLYVAAVYPDRVDRKRLPVAAQQYAAFVKAAPFPEYVSVDRWLQPLAEPVRVRPRLSAGSQQATAFWPFPIVNADRAGAGYYAIYPDRATRLSLATANQQSIAAGYPPIIDATVHSLVCAGIDLYVACAGLVVMQAAVDGSPSMDDAVEATPDMAAAVSAEPDVSLATNATPDIEPAITGTPQTKDC